MSHIFPTTWKKIIEMKKLENVKILNSLMKFAYDDDCLGVKDRVINNLEQLEDKAERKCRSDLRDE